METKEIFAMTSCTRSSAVGFLSSMLALIAAAFMSSSLAEEVHYDVFVTSTGSGSKLVIGGFNDIGVGTALVPAGQMRVFGGEVAGEGTSPYESEAPGEPGFRAGDQAFLDNAALMTPANTYTALPSSTNLTFSFQPITLGAATRNLFFWDGEGPVAFSQAPANVVLGLTKFDGTTLLWTASINGSSNGTVAGNTIQATSSDGSVHTHLYASIAKGGAAPDQGFYLFALELGMAGFTSSDPLYFVYGALDPTAFDQAQLAEFEEAHEAALGWVSANVVPEPATLALAALAAAAAAVPLVRRRRQLPRVA